jgi:hypothetical protein
MADATRARDVPCGSAAHTYASSRGGLPPPSSSGTFNEKRWRQGGSGAKQ